MKLRLLILLISTFAFNHVQGQEIREHTKTMSMGSHNGFFIEFENAEKKNVEKLWKDYLKDYSKKVKKKKDEYYTEEGRIPLVNGSAQLTLYSTLEEGRDMTTLYAWIDLGGAFMNSEDHTTQVEGFSQFMEDFYYIVRKDVMERVLKDEEDILKDLNKDLDKLVDKNEDYHKDIVEAQKKIMEAEEKIHKNLVEQEEKKAEIEKQISKIEKIISRLNSIGKTL